MPNLKVAIVTGASSGIGRSSAIALSKAGWSVALVARREKELRETAEECPNPTLVLSGDVSDENFIKRVFESTINELGRVDLLFNNAGVSKQVPMEDLPVEDFRRVIDVNLTGCFIATQEAFRVFKSQEPQGGRIINNGSLSAHVPKPNSVSYTCSKHAMTGLTKCIALDGRPFNITATQIDIGNAATQMTQNHLTTGALQPDGRMLAEPTIDVQHVADTIVHIASMPPNVAMLEVSIMAAKMPFVGRG